MSTLPTTSSRKLTLAAIAIATALCLALCIALPAPALATGYQAGSVTTQGKTVATKAKKKAKVHKIRTAAQWHNISKYKGGTFKIMKNIKLSNKKYYLSITKNKKYTIDLNGKKVYTTYKGKTYKKRSAPLEMTKGTLVIKDSTARKAGILRGTEAATVCIGGKAKLYLKSGTINNDFLNTQSTSATALLVYGNAAAHLNGGAVVGIVHGVSVTEKAKLYTTGAGTATYPYVRGTNGCGVLVGSKSATLSIGGGSFGTKAAPDWFEWRQSGWYPVLAVGSTVLKQASGLKYVDAKNNTVGITSAFAVTSGLAKRLTTTVKAADGYYTIYTVKA